jgi:putative membrane-bound dehydrogenase-like protein
VTHPFASFLIAGGAHDSTRVEIVRDDSGEVIFRASGDETENLKPVAVDLSGHLGRPIVVRLVDGHSGGWGHINFDDFRFHDGKPAFPARPGSAPLDVIAHNGLAPQEAARAMTVPPGFQVSLFAGEPDVTQPIAMTLDDRGRVWVAEAYSYPIRLPEDQARDRIVIFEDRDGDGRFDARKVFADKLNLVSGLEVGFGGVWVGAAPHLLFLPDRDGDDRPDGPAEVLLDGWGAQDTHETLNAFIWGPDGWLYGCHGVFTHSKVGKPGTPDAERVPINAGVWRYHPTRHVFEVFAHGTSNPWGVDFDDHGQCLITACVIPHLYHMVQGGRYQRQAGQHFNPYTYDDIKTIGDHVHYLGATPHSGNNRSDAAGGGHAHAGAMIYLADAWPAEYRGSLFMNNIHGARINRDRLEPRGSGFVGRHAPDFLLSNDRWSQLLNFRYGPDGNVYMIDWYDANQCHRTDPRVHDRSNGRIFKVSHGDPRPVSVDLRTLPSRELAGMMTSANDWYARHARRILQERAASGQLQGADREEVVRVLHGILDTRENDPRRTAIRLRGLWALHAIEALAEADAVELLRDADPLVRAWTIQLATERGTPAPALVRQFETLARSDPSPVVRLYLASACQRLPLERRWEILAGLVGHAEDAADHNLPLMYWYAAEPLAEADPSRAARLAAESQVPLLLSYMTRRIGAIGTGETINLLVERLGAVKRPAERLALLEGINLALKGKRQVAMPPAWSKVAPALLGSAEAPVRSQALALALTFGDPAARKTLKALATNRDADPTARREALDSLLRARAADLSTTLRELIDDPVLRGPALRGLAAYEDPKTPAVVLEAYRGWSPAERRDALGTLTARVGFARALLDAVEAGKVPATDLTADLIRQLRNLKDETIDQRIVQVWGTARDTTADKAALIAKYRALLTSKPAQAPDPMRGRAVYARTCQPCHMLFGVGGNVGPDLTGSNRADLDYLLANVLDPSALIGKDYQAHVFALTDGRVLTGIIRAEDKDAVTLATANETIVVPKAEIDDRRMSEQSMMPEGQWEALAEPELRALVAYLASPAQVPMLATPDNASTLFNGQDLTGWDGDPGLWRVDNGEIVGTSRGLNRNQFLRSGLAAEDFRLSFQVRLVGNVGNSGVQFRSQAQPDGEMKGYQADIGPGWWGKLYDENGRGLLGTASGESHIQADSWNRYEIEAIGPTIRARINGRLCNEINDPAGARRGIFALQLHAGEAMEVRFKDLRLEVLSQP